MHFSPLFFLFILLLFFASCKKSEYTLGDNKISVQRDISYGNAKSQKFDIYTSTQKNANSKTFVFIHGGGWRGGDKKELISLLFDFAKKFPGDSFVTMNYTLADYSNFALPNQTDEIDLLLKYLTTNSAVFKINPNYILVGNSAGGHLSMLYTFKYNNPKVKGVVNIVGPIALSDKNFGNYVDYNFVQKQLVNPQKINSGISKMDFASPIYWMKSNKTPTISFYGNTDPVVPVSQKNILDKMISEGKLSGETYIFNGSHESWRDGKTKDFILEKVNAFFKN